VERAEHQRDADSGALQRHAPRVLTSAVLATLTPLALVALSVTFALVAVAAAPWFAEDVPLAQALVMLVAALLAATAGIAALVAFFAAPFVAAARTRSRAAGVMCSLALVIACLGVMLLADAGVGWVKATSAARVGSAQHAPSLVEGLAQYALLLLSAGRWPWLAAVVLSVLGGVGAWVRMRPREQSDRDRSAAQCVPRFTVSPQSLRGLAVGLGVPFAFFALAGLAGLSALMAGFGLDSGGVPSFSAFGGLVGGVLSATCIGVLGFVSLGLAPIVATRVARARWVGIASGCVCLTLAAMAGIGMSITRAPGALISLPVVLMSGLGVLGSWLYRGAEEDPSPTTPIPAPLQPRPPAA